MSHTVYDPLGLLFIQPDMEQQYDDHMASEDDDYARKKATTLGLKLVEANATTLFLDFDTDLQWSTFTDRLLPLLLTVLDVQRVWWTASVSKGHKHVYVRLGDSLSLNTRINLQAALGSDPVRELLAFRDERAGRKLVTVFFERPGAIETVVFARDGYQPPQLLLPAEASESEFVPVHKVGHIVCDAPGYLDVTLDFDQIEADAEQIAFNARMAIRYKEASAKIARSLAVSPNLLSTKTNHIDFGGQLLD